MFSLKTPRSRLFSLEFYTIAQKILVVPFGLLVGYVEEPELSVLPFMRLNHIYQQLQYSS